MMKLIGVVLVVVGLALAVATVLSVGEAPGGTPVARARPSQSTDALVSIALPLVAAASFAAGIVLIIVGMGHWSRPRHYSNPGDAVVDPEAHHKMDHV